MALKTGPLSPKSNQALSAYPNLTLHQVYSESIHWLRDMEKRQVHQTLIASNAFPNEVPLEVWSESTHQLVIQNADTAHLYNLSYVDTFQMRSWSPNETLLIPFSMIYVCMFCQKQGCPSVAFSQNFANRLSKNANAYLRISQEILIYDNNNLKLPK